MSPIAILDAVGQIGVAFQQRPNRHLHLILDDRAQGEDALFDPLDFPLQVYRHVPSPLLDFVLNRTGP